MRASLSYYQKLGEAPVVNLNLLGAAYQSNTSFPPENTITWLLPKEAVVTAKDKSPPRTALTGERVCLIFVRVQRLVEVLVTVEGHFSYRSLATK